MGGTIWADDTKTNSLISSGHFAFMNGEYGLARTQYEEALARRRTAGGGPLIAWSLLEIAAAARGQREYVVSRSSAAEALSLFKEREDPNGILACVESVAADALLLGDKQLSARLLGAAEAMRAVQMDVPWNWRRFRAAIMHGARRLRNDEPAAWAEGLNLTLEQVVACALAAVND